MRLKRGLEVKGGGGGWGGGGGGEKRSALLVSGGGVGVLVRRGLISGFLLKEGRL